jgi:4-hydroxy-tetrahydrodipicolinate synthase
MKLLKGTYTALITPFDPDDNLDEDGLRTLLQLQINAGISGIVVMGTTGESPTLSIEERREIIKIAREVIPDNVTLIVGTGHSSTKQTVINTLQAQDLGADMALVVTPYYNKPTQEGIFRHFSEIAKVSTLPLIAYNTPGRSGQNITAETVKRLCGISTVIGIKESSGNIAHLSDIIELCQGHNPDFSVVTGDDPLTLPSIALGAQGVISVISNLMPATVKALVDAALYGDMAKATELHYYLMPFVKAAFLETNPIPIKTAMALKGLPSGRCRLPLCEMSRENQLKLVTVLQSYELDPAFQ